MKTYTQRGTVTHPDGRKETLETIHPTTVAVENEDWRGSFVRLAWVAGTPEQKAEFQAARNALARELGATLNVNRAYVFPRSALPQLLALVDRLNLTVTGGGDDVVAYLEHKRQKMEPVEFESQRTV